MPHIGRWKLRTTRMLTSIVMVAAMGPLAQGQLDLSRYMPPDEIQPGMKGFGRTVMSGTKIETFNIEIISVMHNSDYAKQDLILARCSGLNLEHSGVIAGMSGSPCYIRDKNGRERMIGALAYGWPLGKDPICGIQPITEMLPISEILHPDKRSPDKAKTTPSAKADKPGQGSGIEIEELISKVWKKPITPASRFSIFSKHISKPIPPSAKIFAGSNQLQQLRIPAMVSSVTDQTMAHLREHLEEFGMMPVMSGGSGKVNPAAATEVKLEPGSALCIPLMHGDLIFQMLGTCTEAIGDKIFGFGHPMGRTGTGPMELPLATGMVHAIIPSIIQSFKLGTSLKTVGTLWGDDNNGVFGIVGKSPAMIPLDVVVKDARGQHNYHYEVIQEQFYTPILLSAGMLESIYAHNAPPKEHTIRYTIEIEYQDLGTYRTTNFISQQEAYGIAMDIMIPTTLLMNAPFGKAKVARARTEITIEEGARQASIDQVKLSKNTFKPGETISVRLRWAHFRKTPRYTYETYKLTLPEDLPDGNYPLTLGAARTHLDALRSEKPHLFRADTLAETLETLNLIASFPENRLYMRLQVPAGGLAIDKLEMPELPSYRRRIYADAKRTDVNEYSQALVVQHETDFAVRGSHSLTIQVSRRADQ